MQQQRNQRDEEYIIPGPEALMASTMALMTGHVQSCCVSHREAIVAKIVANLAVLSQDPMLSPGFQALLWSLRSRWLALGQVAASAGYASAESRLWHAGSEVLQ